MVKNYGIHDEWKDLDKVNDIDIKSVDGVIDSIKVNGEEAGGGGGDYPVITATWHEDTQSYTYTCNKEYSYIRNILESWTGGGMGLAGIFIEIGMDGSNGATWTTGDDDTLLFTRTDSAEFVYHPDGTITEL